MRLHPFSLNLQQMSVCERRTCSPLSHAHKTPHKQTNPNSQVHLHLSLSLVFIFHLSNTNTQREKKRKIERERDFAFGTRTPAPLDLNTTLSQIPHNQRQQRKKLATKLSSIQTDSLNFISFSYILFILLSSLHFQVLCHYFTCTLCFNLRYLCFFED